MQKILHYYKEVQYPFHLVFKSTEKNQMTTALLLKVTEFHKAHKVIYIQLTKV